MADDPDKAAAADLAQDKTRQEEAAKQAGKEQEKTAEQGQQALQKDAEQKEAKQKEVSLTQAQQNQNAVTLSSAARPAAVLKPGDAPEEKEKKETPAQTKTPPSDDKKEKEYASQFWEALWGGIEEGSSVVGKGVLKPMAKVASWVASKTLGKAANAVQEGYSNWRNKGDREEKEEMKQIADLEKDAAKPEAVKPDIPKADAPKPDTPKPADAAKPEPDAAKPEPEAPKPEPTKKSSEPQADAVAKAENALAEGQKTGDAIPNKDKTINNSLLSNYTDGVQKAEAAAHSADRLDAKSTAEAAAEDKAKAEPDKSEPGAHRPSMSH